VIEGFLVPMGEVAREARSVEGLTSVGPESLAVTPVVFLGDGARPGVMEERGSVTTAVFSLEWGAPGCSENVSSYHSWDLEVISRYMEGLPSLLPASYGSLTVPLPWTPETGSSP
jgi:hypothetical protein